MYTMPGFLDPEREPHPWLGKQKLARVGKWSFRSSVRLWELCDLALYLTALNRPLEAMEIFSWVSANTRFEGNYDLWAPVQILYSLATVLQTRFGKEEEASETLNAILSTYATTPPLDYLRGNLEDAQRYLEDRNDTRAGLRLQCLTSLHYTVELKALLIVGYISETEIEGGKVDQTLEEGMKSLRELFGA